MEHTQHQERISLYIDNALADKESMKLFAHLAGCDECREFMKIAMRIHTYLMDEDLGDVPLSLDRRVLGGIVKENAQVKRRGWYTPVWFTRVSIPLPAAASILFLIIVGSLLVSPLLSPQQVEQKESKDPLISKVPASVQSQFNPNR